MTSHTFHTDERRWQAVLARDAGADGQFVFAVRTTGIFVVPPAKRAMRCARMYIFILMPKRR